jgi:hypothetical protein
MIPKLFRLQLATANGSQVNFLTRDGSGPVRASTLTPLVQNTNQIKPRNHLGLCPSPRGRILQCCAMRIPRTIDATPVQKRPARTNRSALFLSLERKGKSLEATIAIALSRRNATVVERARRLFL